MTSFCCLIKFEKISHGTVVFTLLNFEQVNAHLAGTKTGTSNLLASPYKAKIT